LQKRHFVSREYVAQGVGMTSASSEFQTKILRRSADPLEYELYRAALEWDLTDPIVIEMGICSIIEWHGIVLSRTWRRNLRKSGTRIWIDILEKTTMLAIWKWRDTILGERKTPPPVALN